MSLAAIALVVALYVPPSHGCTTDTECENLCESDDACDILNK